MHPYLASCVGIICGLLIITAQLSTVYAEVSGYGWGDSLHHVWLISQGEHRHYDYFRAPFHGWLVSLLLPWTSSVYQATLLITRGALIISAISLSAVVGQKFPRNSLAIIGTAAFSLVMLPDVWLWGNGYPLSLAGLCLLLWGGLSYLDTPSRPLFWRLLGCTAFAVMSDSRMLAWLVVLLPAILKKPRWRFVIAVPIVLAAPMLMEWLVDWDPAHKLSWEQQRYFQQQVAQRWATVTQDPLLLRWCQGLPAASYWTPEFLLETCSRATLTHNIERFMLRSPLSPLLMGALMLWAKERWLLVLAALPLWSLAALTVMPQRYLIWSLPLIVLPIALAVGRMGNTIAALVFGMLLNGQSLHPQLLRQAEEHGLSDIESIRALVSTKPSTILDCTPKRYTMVLLPMENVLHQGQPRCEAVPGGMMFITPQAPPEMWPIEGAVQFYKQEKIEVWKLPAESITP